MTALQANGRPGAVGNGGTWARERLNLLSENSYMAPRKRKTRRGNRRVFSFADSEDAGAAGPPWLAPYSWAKPWRRA